MPSNTRALSTAKTIDLLGQLLITPALSVVLTVADGEPIGYAFSPRTLFFSGLFGVGGWQVLSCILNARSLPKVFYTHGRRVYEKLLILVLLAGVAAWIAASSRNSSDLALYFLLAMLFLGPAMALFYLAITIVERQRIAVARPQPDVPAGDSL